MKPISLSISEEMQLMEQELKRHFSPSQLEELARKTGFVQRKSKFTASDFVSLCALLTDDLSTKSLTCLCSQLDAQRNLSMSTEGLNQRFNPEGVTFLQKLFSILLREKIGFHSPILCHFYKKM